MAITDFSVGQYAETQRTFTEADVMAFADVTGDHNPVHIDAEAAAKSPFGERIVHGIFTASLLSALAATELPGPGTIYLAQTLEFKRPVKLGDTVTARVEITAIDVAKRRLTMATTIRNQLGKVVLDGEATLLVPA